MNIKFLPFLFFGTAIHAAIVKPLDSLKVIEVSIAREGLTRIAVKDDRILNVFGVTGEYVLEADEGQGQIFIQPADLGATKSLSLMITTEGGHTQDLRLLPKDQAPEALILESMEDGLGHEHLPYGRAPLLKGQSLYSSQFRLLLPLASQPHSLISRNEIEDLLQACRQEKIPIGYKTVPINWKKSVSHASEAFKNDLQSVVTQDDSQPEDAENFAFSPLLIRELKGERLRGLTYELKNTINTPLALSEAEFAKSLDLKRNSIIAILITKKTLIPGERTFVYVVAKPLE